MEAPADLSSLLARLAAAHGERTAVIGQAETLSFAELDARATVWASAFRAAGVGAGSHVGLLAANGPAWLAVAFGVWRAGATLVPLSTFVTLPELAEILDHADVGFLVLEPRLGRRDFAPELTAVLAATRVRQVVDLSADGTGAGTVGEFLAHPRTATLAFEPPSADGTACILYTSGTTGRPKGVMLRHRAILATVAPTAQRSGLEPGDLMLSSLPLFWVAGLVIRALPTLFSGAGLVLPRTFAVEAVIGLLHEYRPAGIHLRPPQIGAVLAEVDDPGALFACVRRGNGRRDWFQGYLPAEARLITGYGMTEMSGYVVALDFRTDEAERAERIGDPLPGVEVRVVDPEGRAVAPGASGAIQVRGPGMYVGYYKESTDSGRTADGWFDTGDVGSVDVAGRFRFSGRSKDLLRVKGINVSPLEVETVLAAHPGVEAAFVVGLPPDGLDQRVVALVIATDEGAAPTAADLEDWSSVRLSHYKRPEAYVAIGRGDVPFGATSKPQRAALAELAAKRLAGRGGFDT